jgi:hypothetical protein
MLRCALLAQIFLYVGTFIGERLLYMPSLGYCLLLAEPLAAACGRIRLLEPAGSVPDAAAAANGSSVATAPVAAKKGAAADAPAAATTPASARSSGPSYRQWCGRLLALTLLLAYGGRTWVRNEDWASEETLFHAALRVCPDSAKVRLNNGILSRRYQDWEGAIAHFRRAEEVEPGYCEPTYWIGLCKVRHAAAD